MQTWQKITLKGFDNVMKVNGTQNNNSINDEKSRTLSKANVCLQLVRREGKLELVVKLDLQQVLDVYLRHVVHDVLVVQQTRPLAALHGFPQRHRHALADRLALLGVRKRHADALRAVFSLGKLANVISRLQFVPETQTSADSLVSNLAQQNILTEEALHVSQRNLAQQQDSNGRTLVRVAVVG